MSQNDIRKIMGVILIIIFLINYLGLYIPMIGSLLKQIGNLAVLGIGIYLIIK